MKMTSFQMTDVHNLDERSADWPQTDQSKNYNSTNAIQFGLVNVKTWYTVASDTKWLKCSAYNLQ